MRAEKLNNVAIALLTLTGVFLSGPVYADLEDNAVVALGAADNRAVVKTGAGEMTVLTLGDTLPGSKAVIKQILPDKLVVEEIVGDKDKEKLTVWIYKAGKDGKSRVQRLSKEGPKHNLNKPVNIQPAEQEMKIKP